MSEDPGLAALFEVFSGLPRCAPGSDATTAEAAKRLPALPEAPCIADLGSGPGAASVVLARELGVRVVAVDIHAPYLADLRARANRAGLAGQIHPVAGDLARLPFTAGAFDCLWAEGALYTVGVAEGLALWKPVLKPGGVLVASELCWSEGPRPKPAADFFAREYPAMDTEAAFEAKAVRAGYAVLTRFRQPETDWWDAFYTPLETRLLRLSAAAKDDPAMAAVIAQTREEISIRRRFPSAYSYTLFVLRAS